MIIGKVIGGLGNQMFQYTFYKYLAYTKNVNLKLDLEDFKNYDLHNGFELKKVFDVKESISFDIENFSYKSKFTLLFKLENKLLNKNIFFGKKHFKENNYLINPRIFNHNVIDFYVEGYFQTYKYIEYLNNQGISLFKFNTYLNEEEKALLQNNSVSIHIRGGDYIKNPKDKKLFGNICTTQYYKSAIKYMKQNVHNPRFIVFTNDIDYAKTILLNEEYNIVTWNDGENSFRDIYLMTQCKHNIIANSSFSWWGAYLNLNSNKFVISPSKWFNSKKIDQKNIIPSNWLRISNEGNII